MAAWPLLPLAALLMGVSALVDSAQQQPAGDSMTSNEWPAIEGLGPYVGNGALGWLVGSPDVYAAGLYCKMHHFVVFAGADRCRIPAPDALRVGVGSAVTANVTLDTRNAVVTEHLVVGGSLPVVRRWYAHRSRPSVLVAEVTVDNRDGSAETAVKLSVSHSAPSDGLSLSAATVPAGTGGAGGMVLSAVSGAVSKVEPGATTAPKVAVVWTDVPATVTVGAGQRLTITLLAAVRTTVSATPVGGAADPLAAAASDIREAAAAAVAGTLFAEHRGAWAELWSGGVEVQGNDGLARQINSTLYALYSSARVDVEWPAGPGGVQTNGYWGNAFWDNDVWFAPAVLPFLPGAARAAVAYRTARSTAAAAYATKHGYSGLFVPWQTAGSGVEIDLFPSANLLEQHTGLGAVLLLERLYDATGDASLLQDPPAATASLRRSATTAIVANGTMSDMTGGLGGAAFAAGVADFYVSKAVEGSGGPGTLSMKNVVPPDEDATGFPYSGVTDSVYTNAGAMGTALFALRANPGAKADRRARWTALANNLTIVTSGAGDTLWHPEYAGFPHGNLYSGGKVKQADVTLLQYPLCYAGPDMTPASRRNDLAKYEPLYDSGGPAMTQSISVVAWLGLGEAAMAAQRFANSTQNIQAPFNVWTESKDPRQSSSTKDEGCYNFLSGAGGFAQSLVHGYGGLRYQQDALLLQPRLLPATTGTRLRGIRYLGSGLDITVDSKGASTICRAAHCDGGAPDLTIAAIGTLGRTPGGGDRDGTPLKPGSCQTFAAGLALRVMKKTT